MGSRVYCTVHDRFVALYCVRIIGEMLTHFCLLVIGMAWESCHMVGTVKCHGNSVTHNNHVHVL